MIIQKIGCYWKPIDNTHLVGTMGGGGGSNPLFFFNLGTGAAIYKTQVGDDIFFRTISSSTMNITENEDDITIDIDTYDDIGGSSSQDNVLDEILPIAEGIYLFKSALTLNIDDSLYGRNAMISAYSFGVNQDDDHINRGTVLLNGGSSSVFSLSAHIATYSTFSNFTIAFWYRNRFFNGAIQVFKIDDGTPDNRYDFSISNNLLTVKMVINEVTQFEYSYTLERRNNWTHFIIETGLGDNNMYIGGSLVPVSYAVSNSSNTSSLADMSSLTTFEMSSQRMDLDSVYIFNSTLTKHQRDLLIFESNSYVDFKDRNVYFSEDTTIINNTLKLKNDTLEQGILYSDNNGLITVKQDKTRATIGGNLILVNEELFNISSSSQNVWINPDDTVRNVAGRNNNVCIGWQAGVSSTGLNQTNIGWRAGQSNAKNNIVSVGYQANASSSTGDFAISIGYNCNPALSGLRSVSLGDLISNRGAYSVMIGNRVNNFTYNNSIAINATSNPFTLPGPGVYITSILSKIPTNQILQYNPSTSEISYTPPYVEVLESQPSSFTGRVYFDTSDNTLNVHDGTQWRKSSVFT